MDELYDLENAPEEFRYLYREYLVKRISDDAYQDPELERVVRELSGRLNRWQEAIADPLLRAGSYPPPHR